MITVLLFVTAINTGVLLWLVWDRVRQTERIDVRKVADLITEVVLNTVAADAADENGTRSFAKTRYMQLVAKYGLPVAAVDRIADLVWSNVLRIRNTPVEESAGLALYE